MNQIVFKNHLKNGDDRFARLIAGVRSFFSRAHAFEVSTVILALALSLTPVFAVDASLDAVSATLRGSDWKAKYAALNTFKSNRTLEAAQLVAGLAASEPDVYFRLALLDDIASRGYPQVVPQITPLLKDKIVPVRQRTARVIGILGGRPAERALANALALETNADVKSALLQGLSYCGSSQSVPAIQAAMKDSHAHVRANGVTALDRIPGNAAKTALESSVNDKDKNVRKLAQEARKKRTKSK